MQRISIPEIKEHPWFLRNLPKELVEVERTEHSKLEDEQPKQSIQEIMRIIQEAKTLVEGTKLEASISDLDDEPEVDFSGDYVGAL